MTLKYPQWHIGNPAEVARLLIEVKNKVLLVNILR